VKLMPAPARGPHPEHFHAVDGLMRGERVRRVVVAEAAGDDFYLEATASELEGKIGQELAGRRIIGIEEAVEKDDAAGRGSHGSRQ
jgi:hypothetical protein